MSLHARAHSELSELKRDAGNIRDAISKIEISMEARRTVIAGMKPQLAAMETRIAELERLVTAFETQQRSPKQ